MRSHHPPAEPHGGDTSPGDPTGDLAPGGLRTADGMALRPSRGWRPGLYDPAPSGLSEQTLTVHVFPVPRLALGHPFDGRLQPAGACGRGLGLGDPLDVLS